MVHLIVGPYWRYTFISVPRSKLLRLVCSAPKPGQPHNQPKHRNVKVDARVQVELGRHRHEGTDTRARDCRSGVEDVESGKRRENRLDDCAAVSRISELVDGDVEQERLNDGAEGQCAHEVVLQCLDLRCHALVHDLVECLSGQSLCQRWIGCQRCVVRDWVKVEAQQGCDDGSWLCVHVNEIGLHRIRRFLEYDLTSMIMNSVRYG